MIMFSIIPKRVSQYTSGSDHLPFTPSSLISHLYTLCPFTGQAIVTSSPIAVTFRSAVAAHDPFTTPSSNFTSTLPA